MSNSCDFFFLLFLVRFFWIGWHIRGSKISTPSQKKNFFFFSRLKKRSRKKRKKKKEIKRWYPSYHLVVFV